MSKKLAERAHGKRRLFERFGLSLNRQQLRDLVWQIRNSTGVFVRRQSNTRSHWIVTHEGKDLYVVYDNHRQEIVTALYK